MWNYFFYGTLRDPEVAREVLGRPLSGCSPRPCVLDGYKRVYVANGTYPALVADADSRVDGIVVSRISLIEASRLSRYEGSEYTLEDMDVIVRDAGVATVRVFVPKENVRLSDRPWELNLWRKYEKRRFMAGLRRNILV